MKTKAPFLFYFGLLGLMLVWLAGCQNDPGQPEEVKPLHRSLVTPAVLQTALSGEQPPVLIEISRPAQYRESHLPGARPCWRPDYANTEDYTYGGMRARRDQMEALLGRLGVQAGDSIILYDKKGNADAARFWWLLKLYGYDRAALLDGGQPAWEKAGLAVATDSVIWEATPFSFPRDTLLRDWLATREDVLAALQDSQVFLLDTRSAGEFSGEDHKNGALHPGRIPRSVNLDWAYAVRYGDDFCFKSPEELDALFSGLGLGKDQPVIVYCHSGVRSAHTTFVLREILGFTRVANYDGSWTEWSHVASAAEMLLP